MKYLLTRGSKIYAQCEKHGKIFKFYEYQLNEIAQGIECSVEMLAVRLRTFLGDVK